jgi:hypothetical protein
MSPTSFQAAPPRVRMFIYIRLSRARQRVNR